MNHNSSDIAGWSVVCWMEEGRWIESRLRSIFFFKSERGEWVEPGSSPFSIQPLILFGYIISPTGWQKMFINIIICIHFLIKNLSKNLIIYQKFYQNPYSRERIWLILEISLSIWKIKFSKRERELNLIT